jgi:hypothetical protein
MVIRIQISDHLGIKGGEMGRAGRGKQQKRKLNTQKERK